MRLPRVTSPVRFNAACEIIRCGPRLKPPAMRSGSSSMTALMRKSCVPMRTVEQRRFGDGAADIAVAFERIAQRDVGRQPHTAVERIGTVARLQLDELALVFLAVAYGIGHGAHRRRFADPAEACEERVLGRSRLAMHQI